MVLLAVDIRVEIGGLFSTTPFRRAMKRNAHTYAYIPHV